VEVKLLFFSFFLLLWNGGHLILTHFNFSFFCHIRFTGPAVGRQTERGFLGRSKKTEKPTTATATETATTTKQRKTAGGTKKLKKK